MMFYKMWLISLNGDHEDAFLDTNIHERAALLSHERSAEWTVTENVICFNKYLKMYHFLK